MLYPPLLRLRSQHERFQRLPVRVILRFELLAATMMGVTASLFGKRMDDGLAVIVTGHDHLLDQLEVPARLLFVPGRAPGRELNQM